MWQAPAPIAHATIVARTAQASVSGIKNPARATILTSVPSRSSPGMTMPRKTIAVVEDNPDNRLLVQALLDDAYDLAEYSTGGEALSGLRESTADLVLLDISLPGMDGIEVLQAMRADPELQSIPVIALTAHAMSGDKERFLDAGFDDYVAKPIIDETLLLDTIARLLSSTDKPR
jgi:CheY-like chemotaxis protein